METPKAIEQIITDIVDRTSEEHKEAMRSALRDSWASGLPTSYGLKNPRCHAEFHKTTTGFGGSERIVYFGRGYVTSEDVHSMAES